MMTSNNDIPEQKFKIGDKAYIFRAELGIVYDIEILEGQEHIDIKTAYIPYIDGESATEWPISVCHPAERAYKTKQELIEAFIKYVNEELE